MKILARGSFGLTAGWRDRNKRGDAISCIPSPVFREGEVLASGLSSDQFIEKKFLYLLLLSVLLHGAGFVFLYLMPKEQPKIADPTFIDLRDIQELPTQTQPQTAGQAAVKKPSGKKANSIAARTAPAPKPQIPSQAPPHASAQPHQPLQQKPLPLFSDESTGSVRASEPGSSAGELLRRRPQGSGGTVSRQDLMPSPSRMARIEDTWRKKFADEIEDGKTGFLDSRDVRLGSFLRRFETAVYGVWRYPSEAAMNRVEGTTPVKISFNRNGEITNIKLLESSGSRILDDEVFRTLRLLGPLGKLPSSYDKDEFHLIAFFQYGNARSRLR